MRQHKPKAGIHTAMPLKQVGHCTECGLPVYRIGDTIRHIIAEPPPCTQREAAVTALNTELLAALREANDLLRGVPEFESLIAKAERRKGE